MEEAPEKPDRFKTAMPRIPGVSDQPAVPEKTAEASRRSLLRMVVPLAVGAVVVAAMAWWVLRPSRPAASAPALPGETPAAAGAGAARTAAVVPLAGPVEVATLEELSKPWSSKHFLFHQRLTNEVVPALVVRLPGGPANRSSSYWAFSLLAPFGRCELEYVTDTSKLAQQYGYQARHPMVANPCSSTVYDPLRQGTLPGGAWARGEAVQGSSLRPPIAVEVRVEGNHLIALQVE